MDTSWAAGDEETIVRLLSTASPTDAAAIRADLRRDHAAIQGKVGRRRPDIADFWLDAHRPRVLSDVTANVNRLFRNFKTRFYAEVLSRLTGEGLADRME